MIQFSTCQTPFSWRLDVTTIPGFRHPHGGEGEDTFHVELLSEGDQILTETILAKRRLGLAEEDDQIVLLIRVGPGEKTIARPIPRRDHTLLDLDVLHIKKVGRFVLSDRVHRQFGQQIKAGVESDMTHAGPDSDQPRIFEFQFLGHGNRRFRRRRTIGVFSLARSLPSFFLCGFATQSTANAQPTWRSVGKPGSARARPCLADAIIGHRMRFTLHGELKKMSWRKRD